MQSKFDHLNISLVDVPGPALLHCHRAQPLAAPVPCASAARAHPATLLRLARSPLVPPPPVHCAPLCLSGHHAPPIAAVLLSSCSVLPPTEQTSKLQGATLLSLSLSLHSSSSTPPPFSVSCLTRTSTTSYAHHCAELPSVSFPRSKIEQQLQFLLSSLPSTLSTTCLMECANSKLHTDDAALATSCSMVSCCFLSIKPPLRQDVADEVEPRAAGRLPQAEPQAATLVHLTFNVFDEMLQHPVEP
uniref:Uncharacterized protein n=1 Tax=Setaria viridis TaxID=4556 RepID=A0A4U6TPZ7_SETVI|nr:hypothetical protein SEVIR_7G021100v2 [Setaria viridis]